MKTMILLTAICLSALILNSDVLKDDAQIFTSAIDKATSKKTFAELTPRERAERIARGIERRARRAGGVMYIANSQHGKIVFVNDQKIVPKDVIEGVATDIALRDRIKVEVVDNTGEPVTPINAASKKTALGADVAIFITECDKCDNLMLAAPEGAWSMVNAKAICKDAKNDSFCKTRMIKMAERGYYCAAGAMNSQYSNSLMGAVRCASDLDILTDEPPVDVISRTLDSLKSIGVTPQEYTTYQKACQEGWAPAPTNEIQKAIWDKVHALPTDPLKIQYDPKAQQ